MAVQHLERDTVGGVPACGVNRSFAARDQALHAREEARSRCIVPGQHRRNTKGLQIGLRVVLQNMEGPKIPPSGIQSPFTGHDVLGP